MGVKGVSVFVPFAAYRARGCLGIYLEYCVVRSVDVWVYSKAEEMLMVVGIDPWVNFCPPSVDIFSGVHGICIQDTGKFDLKLDCPVLVEDPVHAVFVICGGENMGYEKFSAPCHNDRVVSEVRVLEEDTSVLLVDTNSIFNRLA